MTRPVCDLWRDTETLLFDVEGTLVDAAPLTLRCWRETLRDFGYAASLSALQSLSGMDGNEMLSTLFPAMDAGERDRIVAREGETFKQRYCGRVKPFAGVARLFALLKKSGRRIALATDCSRDELERYVCVTRTAKWLDAAACGDDVKQGKPHAGIVHAALNALRADPSTALMVGDTPCDAAAARGAGVFAVGVLTGGFTRKALREAGFSAILSDLGDIASAFQLAGARRG
ncbi:MAG: HAD family hydrolase [Pseudorhodoplanes sp.]